MSLVPGACDNLVGGAVVFAARQKFGGCPRLGDCFLSPAPALAAFLTQPVSKKGGCYDATSGENVSCVPSRRRFDGDQSARRRDRRVCGGALRRGAVRACAGGFRQSGRASAEGGAEVRRDHGRIGGLGRLAEGLPGEDGRDGIDGGVLDRVV